MPRTFIICIFVILTGALVLFLLVGRLHVSNNDGRSPDEQLNSKPPINSASGTERSGHGQHPPANNDALNEPQIEQQDAPLQHNGASNDPANVQAGSDSGAPLLPWSFSTDDYERIAQDASNSDLLRATAAAKAKSGFAAWSGRSGQRLGGLQIDVTEYELLKSAESKAPVVEFGLPRVAISEDPEVFFPTHVTRKFVFALQSGTLNLALTTAISPGWAHEVMLSLVSRGQVIPTQNSDQAGIGDCGFFGSDPRSGIFDFATFVRHNVCVRVEFLGAAPLDVTAICKQLDRDIVGQSVPVATWADLSYRRPFFTAASLTPSTIRHGDPSRSGTTALVAYEVQDPLKLSVLVIGKCEGQLQFDRVVSPSRISHGKPGSTNRVWLVAMSDSGLWTVEELALKVVK